MLKLRADVGEAISYLWEFCGRRCLWWRPRYYVVSERGWMSRV